MKTFNIIIIFLLVLFVSCRKEFEKPRWDAGILAPLIKTKLGIGDIIKDSVIQKNPDNSLKIVNRELLYSMTLDSLLNLGKKNFPEYNTSKKLSELKLDSKTFSQKITLQQLADQPGNEELKKYVEQRNGPVPAISGINLPPIGLPTGLFFKEADIKEGKMEVTVNNGFPFTIDSVNFRLSNASGSNIYYNEVFKNLTGTPQNSATDLAGKKVEGDIMNAYVLNMATIAAGNIPYMDPNSIITVTIKISDVKVNSANAIFPAQNVIDDSSYVYLVSMGDAKLTEAKLRSGNVRVEVTSTAQDNIYFTYDIPGAIDRAGTRFRIEDVVPPNQSGKPFVKEYDLAGYVLNLRGMNSKGQIREGDTTYNAFFNKITGRIEYTGKLIYLSLNDSMSVKISMENMVPEYVRGYLGQYSVTKTGTAAIDLFKKVTGGELKFEEITNIGIKIENGIGVSGFVDVSSIKGNRPGVTSVEIKDISANISPAIETPLQSVTSTLSLGEKGKDLLNMMPYSIDYKVQAFANKDVDFAPNNLNQFAYYGSPLNIFLDMEVPLNLLANKLQLSDTIEFLTKEIETSVKSGYLNLIANNGFPISANLKLYFLDANKNLTDSLVSPETITPAPASAGKAIGKSQSIIRYNLSSENSIQNILHSKYMVFKAVFDTQPAGEFYKIYSDYELDVTVSGNVNVTIE